MIKSVNQLFNVSDVSLLNATYPEVTQLTIQNSRLSFSEDLTRFFPNVHTVNLSWTSVSCTKDLLWLLTWQDRLVDPEKVLCFTEAGASGSSSLQAIKTLHSFKYVEDNCQSGCNCTYDKNKDYVVISCSNLGLTTLPRVLPWNVTRIELDLSNNKVRNSEIKAHAAIECCLFRSLADQEYQRAGDERDVREGAQAQPHQQSRHVDIEFKRLQMDKGL